MLGICAWLLCLDLVLGSCTWILYLDLVFIVLEADAIEIYCLRRQRYLLGANSKFLSGHLVIVVMSQLNFSTNLSERSSEPVSRLCYPLMLVLPHYNESECCWVEGQQCYHLVLALNLTISEGCWVEGQHSYHIITKGFFMHPDLKWTLSHLAPTVRDAGLKASILIT